MSGEPNGSEETKILRALDNLKRGLKHSVDLQLLNQATLQALIEQLPLTPEQQAEFDARAEALYEDLKQAQDDPDHA